METLKKKSMFWDVDAIDTKKNEQFIIGRILDFGDADDLEWAMSIYGPEKVKKGVLESKTLSRKSLSFWCQYFYLDPSQCISKLLGKTQSAFWKR
ncbi:MAG: hypothetical protein Q7S62_01085 [bacterium]|nr:hypothetical protein [bacterium]